MSSAESPEEELGSLSADTEKDPQDLVANGFRPVWTLEDGYPGPLPEDIREYIDPDDGWNRTLRLVGPMSSLFWLAGLDDLVDAIDSPEFTIHDEVICIPYNASIRSMLPLLSDGGQIPGAVYRNYCHPPMDFASAAFPVRVSPIPSSVTSSVQSHSLRDLFPFCHQQNFPRQLRSVKLPLQKRLQHTCQIIERDFTNSLGGDILFRGLSRLALYSAMARFLPTINSNHADNEFGPGIYTTPSLELAIRYAGAQGAIMVFQSTDFQDLRVWEPSEEDWFIITTYWTGRVLSNVRERVPDGWESDIIRGAVPRAGPRSSGPRVPGPDTQVVAVSNAGWSALAASLKMIIWLE